MEQLASQNAGKIRVVGVGAGDLASSQGFVNDTGVKTPLMVQGDSPWSTYGMSATPSAVLVDASGNVIDTYVGKLSIEAVLSHI